MNVNWITHLQNLLDKKGSHEISDHGKVRKTESKVNKQHGSQQGCRPPLSRQHGGGDHLGSTPQGNYQQLNAYCINRAIVENYERENIKELYPWQAECLNQLKTVKWNEGESFIFVAPTSGGKTLVAEIFAFEQMHRTEKTFFLFPLNSLINEKMSYFQKLCSGTNIKVGSAFSENDIVLCTYERMNNFLNRNYLEGQQEGADSQTDHQMDHQMDRQIDRQMGVDKWSPQGVSSTPGKHSPQNYIVVIDEFHLISEKGRGIYIENIISKILFLNRKQAKIKVICMSGTINNFPTLKKWMNAKIYVSPYRRPQEITEHYICNCGVYRKEKEGCPFSYLCNVHDFYETWEDKSNEGKLRCVYNVGNVGNFKRCNLSEDVTTFYQNTRNNIAHFLKVRNLSLNNNLINSLLFFSLHSRVNKLNTLIFCSTRKNCEVYVRLINQYFSAFPVDDTPREVQLERDKLNEKIRQLDEYAYSSMSRLVSNGICYYYSDIANSIKRLIEVAYKEKTLFLLTCTSTLSVGLNLFVDRVLISSPFIAQNFLSVTQYKQMIGRAARQNKGDSFLLVEKKHEKKILEIFQENCTNITSTMNINDGASLDAMEKYIVEFLCLLDERPVSVRDVVAMLSFSLCFAEVALSRAVPPKEFPPKEFPPKASSPRQSVGQSVGQSARQSAGNTPQNELLRSTNAEVESCFPLEVDEENFTPYERIFYEAKKEQIHGVINVLIRHKCIQVEKNGRKFRPTKFLKSLCISNFSVSIGYELLSEVKKYDRLYLFNYSFHLCYICSPHNLNIASFSYYLPFLKNLITMMCSDNYTKHIIFHVLQFDSDIINMLSLKNQNNFFLGKKKKKFFDDDKLERKHNKLYLSIFLFLYMKGTTCSVLCSLFRITKDVFQTVLQHIYMYMHILISFFDRLDEWIISSFLRKFLENFKECKVTLEEDRTAHEGKFRRVKRKNEA
ncbi:DNA-directed DNA polymerase [Plasmodium coatneyi]|uniref:DNA-directed DNA polymerase n=1 Tax=Plasmodium coatneyi TaxID=208452 RepID=A0A1B1E6U2_9APIC|nr:DNA-directed DNA polymerase [Plasmodium coatneyi]ANQ10687.1 DNA-directed DNA polymerase [Plasmodium coatneyi]